MAQFFKIDNSKQVTKFISLRFKSNGLVEGKKNVTKGDDAVSVKWTDFLGLDGLYANNYDFINKTVELRNAYLRINYGNIFCSIPLKKGKSKNYKCRSRDDKTLTVYMKDPHEIKVIFYYFAIQYKSNNAKLIARRDHMYRTRNTCGQLIILDTIRLSSP